MCSCISRSRRVPRLVGDFLCMGRAFFFKTAYRPLQAVLPSICPTLANSCTPLNEPRVTRSRWPAWNTTGRASA